MKTNDNISVSSEVNVNGWRARYSSADSYGSDDHYRTITRKRSCTDLPCLLIFIIFIGCWLTIGYYAYWNGDISRLSAPRDSYGRVCGLDEDVKDAKYLFFFDVTTCVSSSVFIFGCPTKQICVRKCPEENWFSRDVLEKIKEGFPIDWKQIQSQLICDNAFVAKSVNSYETLQRVIEEERCASYYVKSTSAVLNLCIPNPLSKGARIEETYGYKVQTQDAQIYFSSLYDIMTAVRKDVSKSWHLIALFILTAIVSSLFTIIIMGLITKCFVWAILWLLLFILLYSSVITFLQYSSVSSVPFTYGYGTNNTTIRSNFPYGTVYDTLRQTFQKKGTWLALFCITSGLFVIFGLLILFLRSRIGVAIMLIGEGSKAINAIKSTLCFPLITRLLQFIILIWYLLIFLYVKSMENAVYKVRGLDIDVDCRCRDYKEQDWCLPDQFKAHCVSRSRGGLCAQAECVPIEERSPHMELYFQLFNFFGLLWGVFFVAGFNRMILSYCFASWYWTFNKNDIPFFTLTYSIFVTIRYHLGTIAMGSFLIATCGFIRALLERVQKLVKNKDSLIAECSMWSLRCCFWMLQKFLIFISSNAYIMCSITGKGFFSSASDALGLLTRNVLRVIVLDKVMDFLMFVGKFAVTFILTMIAYFSFASESMGLNYPWVPTTFVGIFTWVISSSFFGVYSIAVDTLFLSFLKDGEMNDGSQTKPYYMSHRLKYMLKENVTKKRKKKSNKSEQ